MSDQDINNFFHQLAANGKIAKGHTVMGELLAAGQFDVAVSIYSHTVDNAAAEGRTSCVEGERQTCRAGCVAAQRRWSDEVGQAPGSGDALPRLPADRRPEGDRGRQPHRRDSHRRRPAGRRKDRAVPEEELLNNPQKWSDAYKGVTDAGGQA